MPQEIKKLLKELSALKKLDKNHTSKDLLIESKIGQLKELVKQLKKAGKR